MSRPGPSHTVSDFSSSTYWATRFDTETSFEWLLPSAKIVEFIIENSNSPPSSTTIETLKCLHLGCGTSDLGLTLTLSLRERYATSNYSDIQVIDTDFVADSINPSPLPLPHYHQIYPLDCLDLAQLENYTTQVGRWDLIIDKSTADAISCGPSIDGVEPLDVLLRNMAKVTKKGTRWISISYSTTRFSALESGTGRGDEEAGRGRKQEVGTEIKEENGERGWRVVEKRFLASTTLPGGRRWRDEKGEERVVFEPETGVWGWVLERV
jgi:hypothetical protein